MNDIGGQELMKNIAASINKDPGALLAPLELVVDDIDNDESLAEVIEAITEYYNTQFSDEVSSIARSPSSPRPSTSAATPHQQSRDQVGFHIELLLHIIKSLSFKKHLIIRNLFILILEFTTAVVVKLSTCITSTTAKRSECS